MRSTMRAMLLGSMLLAVPACVGSLPIVAAPSACADLIPSEWSKGVAGAEPPAPIPDLPVTAPIADQLKQALAGMKGWTSFGIDQSNRLDQANGRTSDAIGIVRRCEERDRAAVKAAKPKVLGIF